MEPTLGFEPACRQAGPGPRPYHLFFSFMEPGTRFELVTPSLPWKYSTTELSGRFTPDLSDLSDQTGEAMSACLVIIPCYELDILSK